MLLCASTGAGADSGIVFICQMYSKARIVGPLLFILAICVSTIAAAQTPQISIKDFETLKGNWKGTLRYLDYGSNKQVTIPANLLVAINGAHEFSLSVYYTQEPDHNAVDKYGIKDSGTLLNEERVVERNVRADGGVVISTEARGTDGNDSKPSLFRYTYTITKNSFTLLKQVKHDGEDQYFERSQYSFTR